MVIVLVLVAVVTVVIMRNRGLNGIDGDSIDNDVCGGGEKSGKSENACYINYLPAY